MQEGREFTAREVDTALTNLEEMLRHDITNMPELLSSVAAATEDNSGVPDLEVLISSLANRYSDANVNGSETEKTKVGAHLLEVIGKIRRRAAYFDSAFFQFVHRLETTYAHYFSDSVEIGHFNVTSKGDGSFKWINTETGIKNEVFIDSDGKMPPMFIIEEGESETRITCNEIVRHSETGNGYITSMWIGHLYGYNLANLGKLGYLVISQCGSSHVKWEYQVESQSYKPTVHDGCSAPEGTPEDITGYPAEIDGEPILLQIDYEQTVSDHIAKSGFYELLGLLQDKA